MAKACSNSAVHGPYEHTLFLGCTILNFSVTVGLNEQAGELTVNLAKDDCVAPSASPKFYWNTSLNKQSTTDADPGFMGEVVPIIGSPVYFRVGDFEFAGLVESWLKTNDSSQNPSYTVKIIAPTRILEGTQFIIGDYSGTSGPLYNTINVFGFAERFGVACSQLSQSSAGFYEFGDFGADGATFGTDSGGWGGSNSNHNGMQWSVIKQASNILLSTAQKTVNIFSPFGRIVKEAVNLAFFGSPWTNGYGLLPKDVTDLGNHLAEYLLDISELPLMPSYFRFSGSNISVMDAISRVCQESGFDFYIELLPVKVPSIVALSGIAKVLKIRTISRNNIPNLTHIQDFIATAQGNDTYIEGNFGIEARDGTTSSLLLGGNKQTVYQAYQNDVASGGADEGLGAMILPYFGLNSQGNYIIPYLDENNFWEFQLETSDIDASLVILSFGGSSITINERELKACEGGADSWLAYIENQNTDTNVVINAGNLNSLVNLSRVVEAVARKKPRFVKPLIPAIGAGAISDVAGLQVSRDAHVIFEWIRGYADDFYGKKFSVLVPYTCVKLDSESNTAIISEHPSNDGGWTEVSTVLGIPINSSTLDIFRDDSNKIGAFAHMGVPSGLDYTASNNDESYVIHGGEFGALYIAADVDEEYVYNDASTFSVPRAVVTLEQPIVRIPRGGEGYEQVMFLVNHAVENLGVSRADAMAMFKRVGGSYHWGMQEGFTKETPTRIAFPMISNATTYGPWGVGGFAGQTLVEKQEGLVPWEFSSVATMNTAGLELAQAAVSQQLGGELGSVTLAGYPTSPLGSEINALDNGVFAGKQLVENRAMSSSFFVVRDFNGTFFVAAISFFNYGFTWGGTFGPNITNIIVDIGPQGVQTTYNVRTYTPKFGHFAELNARRLSQIGQNRMKVIREIRAFDLQASKKKNISRMKNALSEGAHRIVRKGEKFLKWWDANSPHEVFVAEIINGRDTIVTSTSLTELPLELSSDAYDNKAIMSLDGLLSPISLSGDGNLPQVATALKNYPNAITSRGSIGPVQDGPNGTENYVGNTSNQEILAFDLNPLTNPGGKVVTDKSSPASTSGHHIDIVARVGTGPFNTPTGGMIMEQDYKSDYRFMAMRGPMLMAGWGYDLDGKPIPNAADVEADTKNGIFVDTALKNQFLPNHLSKPTTWPVGPIDLRFDRDRGVWTSPKPRENLCVRFEDDIAFQSTGNASVTSPGITYYETGGGTIADPYIVAYNCIEQSISSGEHGVVGFNETQNRWEILNQQGGGSGNLFAFISDACGLPGQTGAITAHKAFMSGGGLQAVGSGISIEVPTEEQWGPIASGAIGYYTENSGVNILVNVEHIAYQIGFTTTTTINPGTREASGTVTNYYQGVDPSNITDNTRIFFDNLYDLDNFANGGSGLLGIGTLDPFNSTCSELCYVAIETKVESTEGSVFPFITKTCGLLGSNLDIAAVKAVCNSEGTVVAVVPNESITVTAPAEQQWGPVSSGAVGHYLEATGCKTIINVEHIANEISYITTDIINVGSRKAPGIIRLFRQGADPIDITSNISILFDDLYDLSNFASGGNGLLGIATLQRFTSTCSELIYSSTEIENPVFEVTVVKSIDDINLQLTSSQLVVSINWTTVDLKVPDVGRTAFKQLNDGVSTEVCQ